MISDKEITSYFFCISSFKYIQCAGWILSHNPLEKDKYIYIYIKNKCLVITFSAFDDLFMCVAAAVLHWSSLQVMNTCDSSWNVKCVFASSPGAYVLLTRECTGIGDPRWADVWQTVWLCQARRPPQPSTLSTPPPNSSGFCFWFLNIQVSVPVISVSSTYLVFTSRMTYCCSPPVLGNNNEHFVNTPHFP